MNTERMRAIINQLNESINVYETISPDEAWTLVSNKTPTDEDVTDEAMNPGSGWGVHDKELDRQRNNINVIVDAMIEEIDRRIETRNSDSVRFRIEDTVNGEEGPHAPDGNELLTIEVFWHLQDQKGSDPVEPTYHISFGKSAPVVAATHAEMPAVIKGLVSAYSKEGWRVHPINDTGLQLIASRRKS